MLVVIGAVAALWLGGLVMVVSLAVAARRGDEAERLPLGDLSVAGEVFSVERNPPTRRHPTVSS